MSTQIDQLANGLPTSMGKRRPSHSTHADDNTRDVVEGEVGNVGSMHAPTETDVRVAIDEELKLPPRPSLVIVLMSNVLMQLTFFIIVSSSNSYAKHLGGTETFSGLVIGIPTAVAALTLIPLMNLDKGGYSLPINFSCGCLLLGNILYALAYRANFLYLILIGRMVCGCGFTFWMYAKRYCSDPRTVGIRRRTTLAGWQVLGQGIGFSLGPFVGGLLTKIGYSNAVFNGYTSPAWLMAAMWLVFWICVRVWFKDTPEQAPPSDIPLDTLNDTASVHTMDTLTRPTGPSLTKAQWGVTVTMCWFAMTFFFILAAWESNIPVFTASDAPQNPFNFSPFAAGNLIALGGACTMPFLLINLHTARKMQDRHTLVVGVSIGFLGLVTAMGILGNKDVSYGSYFAAWFLVALGFNIGSTVTIALLSKQLPGEWNGRISLIIQLSMYTGRVTGAVWGGAGVKVGMLWFIALQMIYVGIGGVLFITLWKNLKAKTG